MIEYTKGPWRWKRIDAVGTLQLEGSGEHPEMNPVLVAYKCGNNDGKGCQPDQDPMCPLEPSHDDRKLIKFSPELYEACLSFYESLSPESEEYHPVDDWKKVKEILERIDDDPLKSKREILDKQEDSE